MASTSQFIPEVLQFVLGSRTLSSLLAMDKDFEPARLFGNKAEIYPAIKAKLAAGDPWGAFMAAYEWAKKNSSSESPGSHAAQLLDEVRSGGGAANVADTPSSGPGGNTADNRQDVPVGDTREKILDELRAGTINVTTAARRLAALSVPTAGVGPTGTPTTSEGEALRAALRLEVKPKEQYEQLFDISKMASGRRLDPSLFNFLGAPAKSAFELAPFFRPNMTPTQYGRQGLADFMGGGFGEDFQNVPSPEDIFTKARSAFGPGSTFTPAQQAVREVYSLPSSNMAGFNLLAAPWLSRVAEHRRGILDRYISRLMNQFQFKNPEVSFLPAMSETGPSPYSEVEQMRSFLGF